MTESATVITERNLSAAWALAFSALVDPPASPREPLVVSVTGFDRGEPVETRAVRDLIDRTHAELHARDSEGPARKGHQRSRRVLTCETVANTIFPSSLWQPNKDRSRLFARYLAILPKLKRDLRNRRGLYFERLVAYGRGPQDGNQLEHLITAYAAGVRRVSAFQATICDPTRDLTMMPLQGFPCLQQIAVHPDRTDGTLAITGFYGTQYVFDRAYGNYLGLSRLGHFLAHEMGLNLVRMTCIASRATLGEIALSRARRLMAGVNELLESAVLESASA